MIERHAFCYGKPFLQANENCVVKCGTDLLNRFIGPVGPGAIRQQYDSQVSLRINPERRSGISQMPDRRRAEVFS
jgi:hypothetical protein